VVGRKWTPPPEIEYAGFVYILKCHTFPFYKIGSARDIDRRVRDLQSGCPFSLSIIAGWRGDVVVERQLQHILGPRRIKNEWYELTEKELEIFLRYVAARDMVLRERQRKRPIEEWINETVARQDAIARELDTIYTSE
jgi:hypothetical protein